MCDTEVPRPKTIAGQARRRIEIKFNFKLNQKKNGINAQICNKQVKNIITLGEYRVGDFLRFRVTSIVVLIYVFYLHSAETGVFGTVWVRRHGPESANERDCCSG